jgi:hypothetical protein
MKLVAHHRTIPKNNYPALKVHSFRNKLLIFIVSAKIMVSQLTRHLSLIFLAWISFQAPNLSNFLKQRASIIALRLICAI